jgi:hypothetical protein
MYIPDGHLMFPNAGSRVSEWRRELKYGLLWRDTHCRECGDALIVGENIHMHEGIVSRAQIMGLPKRTRIMFFNELNCVLLCGECNIMSPPSKQKIWSQQLAMYDDILVRWYDSLSSVFKVPLQQFDS